MNKFLLFVLFLVTICECRELYMYNGNVEVVVYVLQKYSDNSKITEKLIEKIFNELDPELLNNVGMYIGCKAQVKLRLIRYINVADRLTGFELKGIGLSEEAFLTLSDEHYERYSPAIPYFFLDREVNSHFELAFSHGGLHNSRRTDDLTQKHPYGIQSYNSFDNAFVFQHEIIEIISNPYVVAGYSLYNGLEYEIADGLIDINKQEMTPPCQEQEFCNKRYIPLANIFDGSCFCKLKKQLPICDGVLGGINNVNVEEFMPELVETINDDKNETDNDDKNETDNDDNKNDNVNEKMQSCGTELKSFFVLIVVCLLIF